MRFQLHRFKFAVPLFLVADSDPSTYGCHVRPVLVAHSALFSCRLTAFGCRLSAFGCRVRPVLVADSALFSCRLSSLWLPSHRFWSQTRFSCRFGAF